MDRIAPRPALIGSIVVVGIALAGCSAATTPAPSAAPEESMMADHSPMAPESMAEESAMPSESMADASAMPSESMADESPSAAAPVSTGTFHGVDGTASGTVALFHKPDGSFVVTFEDFAIDSAANTHVVLVTNKDVTADADVDKTSIVDLGALTGTSGMQDFTVPAGADAMTLHTVVLWDSAMAHAIAAAPLH
jgi:hypothetical protein